MPRFFIELSYMGTAYNGWQIQPNAPTVQETLARALRMLLRREIELTGTGRTDTEVHALSYIAHFDCDLNEAFLKDMNLVYKLNRVLPPDISIQSIREVKEGVHARFSALSRSYKYHIATGKNPFYHKRAWLMERELCGKALNEAAAILLEYEDFQCFSKANTQVNNYLCKIEHAYWTEEDGLRVFHIKSNRFLRNMVRAIVGTLVDVGLGKTSPADFREILESKNRSRAGYSAPGYGLYFIRADFPEDIYLKSEHQ